MTTLQRKFFTLERVLSFIAGALFTIVINVISNWLSAESGTIVYATFLLAVVIGAIALAVASRNRRILVKAVMSPPISLDQNAILQGETRKGLVAFVSLYNPLKDERFRNLSPIDRAAKMKEMDKAAQELNYQELSFEKSNLEPLIKAISCHQPTLEKCWLIATGGPGGSNHFVPALVKFLYEEKGFVKEKCNFIFGDRYELLVNRVNETEVVEITRKLVDRIFGEAEKEYQLKEKDLICDITSGFRSMPLGMTLACLDESRDLEFVGTQYGQDASPTGELHPMIFRFETRILEENA